MESYEDALQPAVGEKGIQRLFTYLKNCQHIATRTMPCIAYPYKDGLWADLIKANDDVNLLIRYSARSAYNKTKIKEELFSRPENALIDFFDVEDKLAPLPLPWKEFYPNEPVVIYDTTFFQSKNIALAPPFEWRNEESFKEHFNTITKGIFSHMDFTHASIAGQSILSMLHVPRKVTAPDDDWVVVDARPEYFHVDDLNIYIHSDIESEEERKQIAIEILDGILLSYAKAQQEEEEKSELNYLTRDRPPAVEKTEENIKILIPGMPVITIIPSFKPESINGNSIDIFPPLSRAHLLHTFDIDSYCFAYDGAKIWTTLRGIRAACSTMNVANPSYKSSTTYEDRLFECRRRGYTIAVPNAGTTRHLHAKDLHFLPHNIDIPRLYSMCYPHHKEGGNGIAGWRPPSPSSFVPRSGFFNTLRWIFSPLW